MKATVSSKGQVTIPKALRDRLAIRQGTVVDFREDGGRLVVAKVAEQDPVTGAFGILRGSGRRSDEVIDELRGPPPRP